MQINSGAASRDLLRLDFRCGRSGGRGYKLECIIPTLIFTILDTQRQNKKSSILKLCFLNETDESFEFKETEPFYRRLRIRSSYRRSPHHSDNLFFLAPRVRLLMLATLLALFHLLLGNKPRLKSIAPSTSTDSNSKTKMGNDERTFIMIKPDGVQRGLCGDIIKRFEQKGFKLVAMKFMQVCIYSEFKDQER